MHKKYRKRITKLWLQKIKENISKWRNIPYPWIGRLNVVKMSILPKLIYRFKAIQIKISINSFSEISKVKRPRINEHNTEGVGEPSEDWCPLEKTLMLVKIEGRRRRGWQRVRWLDGITDSMDVSLSKLGSWWWTGKPGMLWSMGSQRVGHNWVTELNWTEFNTYYKSTVIVGWYWKKNRQIAQWNRIESSEIDPHKHNQLIFDKDTKKIQWKNGFFFSTSGVGTARCQCAKKWC